MAEIFKCKHCEGSKLFIEKNGPHTGLYCSECGTWNKWMNKKDVQKFMSSTYVNTSSNTELYTHTKIDSKETISVSKQCETNSKDLTQSPPWEV